MYGSEGSHSGTLMYGSEGSHSVWSACLEPTVLTILTGQDAGNSQTAEVIIQTDDGVTGMCLECLFGTYSTYNINRSRCRQLSDS